MLNVDTVKYTATLRTDDVKLLKRLAVLKIIPSINHGIRTAVSQYLVSERKKFYAAAMKEAAKDKNFLERMSEAESDFRAIDNEGLRDGE